MVQRGCAPACPVPTHWPQCRRRNLGHAGSDPGSTAWNHATPTIMQLAACCKPLVCSGPELCRPLHVINSRTSTQDTRRGPGTRCDVALSEITCRRHQTPLRTLRANWQSCLGGAGAHWPGPGRRHHCSRFRRFGLRLRPWWRHCGRAAAAAAHPDPSTSAACRRRGS